MAVTVDANTLALYKFNDNPAGTGYATAVDSASFGGTQRNLSAAGEGAAGTVNLMHIVNGPGGNVDGSYARWFPGTLSSSNAHLERAGDATLAAALTGSYTLECWIRMASLSAAVNRLFEYAGVGETLATNLLAGWEILTSGLQQLAWEHGAGVNDFATQTTGAALSANTWYHAAMTVDNSGGTSTVKVYLNGAVQQTISGVTKAAGGTSATLTLGGSNGTLRFHGAVKSLVLRNTAYSAAQIAADAALTTYQHVVDSGTVLAYQFNEAPDVLDESSYGYHLRKTAGNIWRVDPLYPDEGYSAFFDTATEYDGHWGYSALLAAFTSGVWTFDCWIRMNANYNNVIRGFFRWGDDGATEVQADNTLLLAIDTARKPYVFEEYGAGTNSVYIGTNEMFSNAVAYNRHHLAVVHNGLTITTYIDGVQVDTGDTTQVLDGSSQCFLRLGSNTSTGRMSGSMDNARLRNVAVSAADILRAFVDGGGADPNYSSNFSGARRSSRSGVK